jgi:hypothetical protein
LLRSRDGITRIIRLRRIVLGAAARNVARSRLRGGSPRTKGVIMTKDALTRESIAVYGLPFALLLIPTIAALFLPNWFQFGVPLIALGVGVILRPRSLQFLLSALYVVMLAAAVGALALGRELPKMPDDNQGLAPASLFFTALLLFAYLAFVVALPLAIGRWLGTTATDHRHEGASPA